MSDDAGKPGGGVSEPARIPVVEVTVLEDRASVVRRGTTSVAAGQQRIVIERVSPVLADKTLTATVTGARVLDVRCERYVAPWRERAATGDADATSSSAMGGGATGAGAGASGGGAMGATPSGGAGAGGAAPAVDDVTTLRAQRVQLAIRHDTAVAVAATARAEADALVEIATAALSDLAVAATRGTAPDGAAAQLADLDRAEADARRRRVEAELAVRELAAALARLDGRIARAEAEAGEQAARLVIDLVAEAAGDITLTTSYVVPGAAWRPYHRALLDRGAAKVEWQTTACVWQATGEDWTDAELRCSLERPSLGVEPPDLGDDELQARRRAETVVVEAREQEQQTTGLGAGALEVPGIDDGGLGLRLTSRDAVTVRADGAPHRVVLGGFAGPAQLSLVAIPLRSSWVHVRARIVNTGGAPLLAGPVDLIMASGYVGRAEIGFVAAGEKVHVGFGPEADVRVHRDETRERDDAGLLGGWNVQTVRVAVRLSNLGAERREVIVTERIPISEVEQVDVQVSAADAYLLGDDDQPRGEEITQVTARALDERGLVSWTVELPPLGRRAVTLEYKIKSQRSVAGAMLDG